MNTKIKKAIASGESETVEFVRKHINRPYIITGRPQREERWEYPLDAIREIVINSIIHRE